MPRQLELFPIAPTNDEIPPVSRLVELMLEHWQRSKSITKWGDSIEPGDSFDLGWMDAINLVRHYEIESLRVELVAFAPFGGEHDAP